MNFIKVIIIILFVLLYWKFIYYKYHRKPITPISFFIFFSTFGVFGIYLLLKNLIFVSDIIPIYTVLSVWTLVSWILVIIAKNKHRLNDNIDITLTWCTKKIPFIPYYFWMIITFPAFFLMMLSSRFILGPEHIFLWGLIFLAWVKSDYILIKKSILK